MWKVRRSQHTRALDETTVHAPMYTARCLSVLPAPQVSAAALTDLMGHGHARGAAEGGEVGGDEPGWAALPAFEALCVCLYVLRPAALGSFVAEVGTRLTCLLHRSAGRLWCGGVGALGTADTGGGGAGEVSSHHTPPKGHRLLQRTLRNVSADCLVLRRAAPRNSCVYSESRRQSALACIEVSSRPPLGSATGAPHNTQHGNKHTILFIYLVTNPLPTGESAGGEAHSGGARASRAAAGGGAPGRGGHGGALAANIRAGTALVRACVVGLFVPTLPAQP